MKPTVLLIMFSLLAISLVGCMSSGIIDMGHDKYMVNYTSTLGNDNAREWAYATATNACKDRNRELYSLSESPSTVRGSSSFALTFMCLDKNDPQLKQFRNYTR